MGAGNQEQLRQLWQAQLELEGLVDGSAGTSGNSSRSGSSSSPGQLRGVLPPDLLLAAEEAAGQGPGGVRSTPGPLRHLWEEVCSVLQGMVQQGGGQQGMVQQGGGQQGMVQQGGGQQGGGQQEGQGAQGQRLAGPEMETSGAGSLSAAEEGSATAGVAAGPVHACTILSVNPRGRCA